MRSVVADRRTTRGAPTAGPDRSGLIKLGVTPPLGEYVRALWSRREFISTMSMSDLRARNMNTVLGAVWHLLNPLLLAAVYFVVFGYILEANKGIGDYPVFLLVGLMTFHFTSKCLTTGSRTIISNVGLLTSLYFPRAVLPLIAVVTEIIAHLPAILTMFVGCLYISQDPESAAVFPSFAVVAIIPLMAVQSLFNFGLAALSGRATVHFRDIQNLLPVATRIWFYVSGIFFDVDAVKGTLGTVLRANPLYAIIKLTRGALMYGSWGTSTLWWTALAWGAGFAIAGFFYFRSYESEYGGV